MPLMRRLLRALAVVILLVPMLCLAQSIEDSDTTLPDSAPTRAREPFTDERAQALRQQIQNTSEGEEQFKLLMQLSQGYQRAGRVADSLKVREEIIDNKNISVGKRSITASKLALSEALIGNFPRSQRLASRGEELAHQTPASELENISSEPGYAFLSAEAEIERRAHGRHDLALLKYQEHQDLAFANLNDAKLSDARHRAAANELFFGVSEFVRILVQNNRRSEALSYALAMRAYVESHPEMHLNGYLLGHIQMGQAIALCSFDDYESALKAIDESIASFRQGGATEHDAGLGNAWRMRLMIALGMGRLNFYQADAAALGRGRAVDPVLAGSFPAAEYVSLALASEGKWTEAADQASQAKARSAKSQGTGSPFYKYQYAMEMVERLSDPVHPVSASDVSDYVTSLMSSGDDWADGTTRGAYLEDAALAMSVDRLMQIGDASSQALAFRIAELMRLNASQGALSDGAARLAASDPSLRGLIEQEQSLRFDQASNRLLFAQTSDRLERLTKQPDPDQAIAQRLSDEVAAKEQALTAAQARLIDLRRQISQRFPIYRELVAARIPEARELGAVLKPDEAYLNVYAGRTATAAFLVRADGQLQAIRLGTTRDQLQQLVTAIRRGFDAGLPPAKPGDTAAFDSAAALSLYQSLIKPFATNLAGIKTVYISSGGVLSNLPWNTLITNAGGDLNQANWWISSTTPVLMPSGSALVLERSHPAKTASVPMLAFADPSFDGVSRPPINGDGKTVVRSRALRQTENGPTAIDYHLVTPLPETYAEVEAIGQSVNATPNSVIRGVDATRSRVLKESLADKRVVVFATHGILPGEVPGMRKAGLAMAYEGRGLADSVLTIDDIITLRLNADWVVLSACNTGYASGDAGDTISALARGFFAAGGRSLLVTQWAVESNSAKDLTTRLFKSYSDNPSLSKADAMANAERDMQAGLLGELYRHPYFWGAYTIEGDAAR